VRDESTSASVTDTPLLIEGAAVDLAKFVLDLGIYIHRRTSRCPPPDSGKAVIFRAKAKFFGQKPAAKNEKKIFFVFIKRINGIHSVYRDKVREIRDFY